MSRRRYAYMRDVSEAIHLDCVDDGDSIQAWTSATTSIRRRNCRTSAVTAWQNVKLKTCFDGPWKIDRGVRDRGSLWVGPKLVIYVPDPVPDSVFVITAYQLGAKALKALRRRRRRRR